MADTIGRFEILSEISRSRSGCVYKASDPESGQTVALKAVKLDLASEEAKALLERLLQEADTTKPLNSQNIAMLYGAGDIDGHFCASMEYVQGKSVASMLSRNDVFSVWDLQDIARQACQALDHAHAHQVVHYTLEPGKLMVSWDGTVKILAFGISGLSAGAAHASGPALEALHYMSPEQVRGEPLDARSNLFSLAAVLYEMVTGRKAFGGEDADQLRQEILVGMPVAPAQILPKIHPRLSEVIMKALAKAPAQRYQSGQDLVSDLENCKEPSAKAPARKNPASHPPEVAAPQVKKSPEVAIPARKAAAAAGASSVSGIAEFPSNGPAQMSSAWPTELDREGAGASSPADGDGGKPAARTFSEIDALPPLQERHTAPASLPAATTPGVLPEEPRATMFQGSASSPGGQAQKIKMPASELTKRAAKEILQTPPKLFLYSIAGAVIVILLVVSVIYSHVHSESAEENASATQAVAQSTASHPAQSPTSQLRVAGAVPVSNEGGTPPGTSARSVISVAPKYAKRKAGKVAPPPAPVIVPGQLTVNSTPEGAQVLLDGHRNPAWLTPLNMSGLAPGQHLVSVSKPGFSPEMRTIDVASGSKSFLVVQLAALGATAFVSSVPPGAQVIIDGRDSGKVTPVELPVDKPGNHSFLVKKQGYLDSASTANLQPGQTFQFAPVLQALGVTDEIKLGGGHFKKIFGGGETAGMGSISVKTQPKGAQVAINRRVLDKASPVDFYLNPGTYLLDVTLSGYGSVHRVITVERGGKLAIDESLERQ